MRLNQEVPALGIRWTIGDVSDAGYEALRLSIWSAWNLFGENARYAVCVNTLSLPLALARTGSVPSGIEWLHANDLIPDWLTSQMGRSMAEGVAWKLAPVRIFPSLHELSLDNDVLLWKIPSAIDRWLTFRGRDGCLIAADVSPALGQFSEMCRHRPLNSGIRGLPPGFDMESRLRRKLTESGIVLESELDEQGLQAAVLLESKLFVIDTDDVSICSPFPMHQQHLGRCGVHFVGLNPKRMPWTIDGRAAHELIRERWKSYAGELERLIWSNRFSDRQAPVRNRAPEPAMG
jgi:hypothetical protein